MAQCMESGIAPASSCGMKVGRSYRARRMGSRHLGGSQKACGNAAETPIPAIGTHREI